MSPLFLLFVSVFSFIGTIVTIQQVAFREVFWHVYVKMPSPKVIRNAF